MPLIDTGLVVRYYIDEAADGTGPTEVLDGSGVGAAFNLTINYNGVMDYTEVGGNRGLECTDVDGDAYARKLIDNSSDKVRDNLHGQTKFTYELVVDWDAWSSSNGRSFVINETTSDPDLGIIGEDQANTWFYYNKTLCRTWTMSASRTVYHVVVDTTQGTAADRIIVYADGSDISAATTADPGQNDTLSLSEDCYLYMFNRGATGGTWARSMDGIIFYAALYGGVAFTQANVTNNYNVLTSDDDTPSAESEWTTHTHSTIVFS